MTIRPPRGLLLDCSNDPLTDTLEILKVGTQLRLSSSATDYATIAVAADGLLAITTVDADAAEGDICLMPDGNVAIGTLTPETKLHLFVASAGAISPDADHLAVIENNANAFLAFHTPNTHSAGLVFGDTGNNAVGQLLYNHATNALEIIVAAAEAARVTGAGLGIGTGVTVDRLLHAEVSDAGTNAVVFAQRLSHITSGTPVAGFGTGIEFELEENAGGTNRVAAYITADWEDAGETASADGRLNFGVMTADAAAATAMAIWNNHVGINVQTPAAKLHIDQSVDSAAIPVLSLDQADLSEGFVNFLGTAAASATGPLSSWTTGATIQGFYAIEINNTRYWAPYYDAPTS